MAKTDGPMIEAAGHTINPRVLAGIKEASRRTGVDFSYLMAQASKESNFSPEADARMSSASGLYQFTTQTWLGLVRSYGGKYGHADLAAKIQRTGKGEYFIENPADRQAILELRREPKLSALMAGEYANRNK
ncbi:MAG: lytic transglycosylase domain-containing protein, partial [Rhodospirillales bacterium]|nr:lytic transglycosylase domain-containing protein [Rhodospirillales bacterium]